MSIEEYEKELENLKKEKEKVQNDKTLKGEKRKEALKTLKEKETNLKINYRRQSQGNIRNLFSSFIGQADKRIHNFVYKEDGKKFLQPIREKLYNWSEKRFNNRYENPLAYIIKNTFIAAGMIIVPWVAIQLVPALSVISLPVALANYAFLGQTIIKSVSAIYNIVRYDGANFERRYDIRKGSFIENIKSSLNSLTKSKTLSGSKVNSSDVNKEKVSHTERNHESGIVSDEVRESLFGDTLERRETDVNTEIVNSDRVSDDVRSSLFEDVVSESRMDSREDSISSSTIKRNRRLGRFNDTESTDTYTSDLNSPLESNKANINLKENYKDNYNISNNVYKNNNEPKKESNLHFSDAVHILRDKQNNYSEKQKEEALNVVARSFGNKKVSTEDIRKKLSDYNKLEQLLGYYGNKVKTNTATLEDMSFYSKLLEQFGRYNGNDYTLTDLMADEAYYNAHPEERSKGR